MESPFQIIQEYEILKNILSHLNYRELKIASCVCQNWKRVADLLIQKNVEISCVLKEGKEWPPFNLKICPKLVIYNSNCKKRGVSTPIEDVKKCLEKSYSIKNTKFIYLVNWKLINTLKEGSKFTICQSFTAECDDNSGQIFNESLLMIPEFKHFNVDVDYIGLRASNLQTSLNTIKEKVRQANSCILITGSRAKIGLKIVKELVQDAKEGGTELIMAGGIAEHIMCGDSTYQTAAALMLTFNGECLSSNSFVVPIEANLSSSFTKMSEELGPLEAGYERLAFIFTCVDRHGILGGEEEINEFSKLFPNVHLNGFWSLGEYCMNYPGKHKKLKTELSTQPHEQFYFTQASTYLFLTFKK